MIFEPHRAPRCIVQSSPLQLVIALLQTLRGETRGSETERACSIKLELAPDWPVRGQFNFIENVFLPCAQFSASWTSIISPLLPLSVRIPVIIGIVRTSNVAEVDATEFNHLCAKTKLSPVCLLLHFPHSPHPQHPSSAPHSLPPPSGPRQGPKER